MVKTLSTAAREKKWKLLRSKLDANAAFLLRRGVLATTRTRSGPRVWVVRFFVCAGKEARVHRNIYIGADPVLVERTRRLLHHYRSLGDLSKQLSVWSRVLATACSTVRRVLRRARGRVRSGPGDATFSLPSER
jgi:hypothetical protein